MSGFLKRKGVVFSLKRYFVDAFGAMALGLFASLLIGTIFNTVYETLAISIYGSVEAFTLNADGVLRVSIEFIKKMSEYAQSATGAAMAVAIGSALGAPSLVLLSLCAVGLGANSVGGPLGTFIAVLFAAEIGKMVSKETKVDIIVTPTVTIAVGTLITLLIGPGISEVMKWFGNVIMTFTELRPFWMGILVSVTVGIALTLPISSAAICAAIGLVGLAGGAATAGCCAQMVGFAVMSFKENKWGGLAAQGLGTSMLQMGNIMKNPIIWIPPTLASAITGPLATCVFKMENSIAVASGMGTCGLVGPIGVMSSPSFSALGIVLICFVLPAVLTPLFAWPLRHFGLIKEGDLKLEL